MAFEALTKAIAAAKVQIFLDRARATDKTGCVFISVICNVDLSYGSRIHHP